MLRELITRPIGMIAAILDLPRTLERSVREANALMEISREQLDLMRRQADEALAQAERMNDLLARVVKLTEPIERAQRGGEYVAGAVKQMIFGEESGGQVSPADARAEELTRQAERAESAANQAETAAEDAETAAEDAEGATDQADQAEQAAESAEQPEDASAIEISDGTTIRVIPNQEPKGDEPGP